MNIIAEVIASRRKELGLSQKALAEKLHVSDKTLSRWETGKQIPDALTLLNIAKALDLTISEMYGTKETIEAAVPQPVDQKRLPANKILTFVAAVMAAAAAIVMLLICIGNLQLKSKVFYSAKEVPMYALTAYDYSIVDWIKGCNKSGEEISCISSLERDPETGKDIAHYLFYLPHGYENTDVKVRCQLGRDANVLKLDFKNTTQTMDDSYYLCYVQVDWEDELFTLETTLDGKIIRCQGIVTANHVSKLCRELFDVEGKQ